MQCWMFAFSMGKGIQCRYRYLVHTFRQISWTTCHRNSMTPEQIQISATRARKRKRFFRVLGSKARHAHFRSAPDGQSAVLSEGAKIECKRLERSATFINHPFQTLLPWQTHHVQLGKGPEFYSNNTYAALGSSLRPPNKGEAKQNPQIL